MITMLIGLTGKAKSGKDTTFKIIDSIIDCKKYSIADVLRSQACAVGFSMFQLTDQNCKELDDLILKCSPRKYLQHLGDLNRSLFGESYVFNKLDKCYLIDDIKNTIVVTDIRLNSEAEYIKSNNGIIINLYRTNSNQLSESLSNHVTESVVDEKYIDHHI